MPSKGGLSTHRDATRMKSTKTEATAEVFVERGATAERVRDFALVQNPNHRSELRRTARIG